MVSFSGESMVKRLGSGVMVAWMMGVADSGVGVRLLLVVTAGFGWVRLRLLRVTRPPVMPKPRTAPRMMARNSSLTIKVFYMISHEPETGGALSKGDLVSTR